ncbi:MAG: hypothetical protein Q7J98_09955 [Kiritimatiellia bacterium]|nr:hypothetical protein [Kiritimatiellia bacterium]
MPLLSFPHLAELGQAARESGNPEIKFSMFPTQTAPEASPRRVKSGMTYKTNAKMFE